MAARRRFSESTINRANAKMHNDPVTREINVSAIGRNVLFILIGAIFFLLKTQYAGPLEEIVHAYLGNFSVSFAVYFVFANLQFGVKTKRLVAASSAFAVVELFEAFDGFGVMSNTYDPIDFFVNAVGIAVAFWLDTRLSARRADNLTIKPS
jgi:hypothetical protein